MSHNPLREIKFYVYMHSIPFLQIGLQINSPESNQYLVDEGTTVLFIRNQKKVVYRAKNERNRANYVCSKHWDALCEKLAVRLLFNSLKLG